MSSIQIQTSFTAGELSPLLAQRVDIEKFRTGLAICENMIVYPYGLVTKRPGTEYLGVTKFADRRTRLIDFETRVETRYILEVGHEYIRVWQNGAYTGVEIITPYQEEDLFELQFASLNDISYLVHEDYSPMKLSHFGATSWTFAPVTYTNPPLRDENLDESISIVPSAINGNIQIVSNMGIFTQDQVGSYFEICQEIPIADTRVGIALSPQTGSGLGDLFSSLFELQAGVTSSTLTAQGTWEFSTFGSWTADIYIEIFLPATNEWVIIRSFNSQNDQNYSEEGTLGEKTLMRIRVENWTTSENNNPRVSLQTTTQTICGLVQITSVPSDGSSTAGATVIKELLNDQATIDWSEGAWSNKNGHPRSVSFHEQRLVLGGTKTRPQTVWGSAVDDFENFDTGTDADQSYEYTIASNEHNAIQWLNSADDLLIGTAGGEWVLGSSREQQVITPENVRVKRHASFGSEYRQAILVNNTVIYVQRGGRKIRNMAYSFESDGYSARDLTILSEHITKGKIVDVAYQQNLHAIFWATTGDGNLIGLTYETDQNVNAWHRHTTPEGRFESVATTYGEDEEDEVYVIVQRGSQRNIERIRPNVWRAQQNEDRDNWFFLDCGAKSATGLDHLNGQSVTVLENGKDVSTQTVTGGSVNATGTVTTVGIPYEARIETMNLESALQNGTSQSREMRVHQLEIYFYKSLGGFVSGSRGEVDSIKTNDPFEPVTDPPKLNDSFHKEDIDAGHNKEIRLKVWQNDPFPFTILSIIPKFNTYGDA